MEDGSKSNFVISVSTKRSLKLRCFQLATEKTGKACVPAACTSLTRTRLSVANAALK